MRFGVLGPLLVTGPAGELRITAGRDRIVLAMLLLHAGRVVGVDDLVDAVWGAGPPATARGQLQTCVSRLRRLLSAEVIRTDPAGYALLTDDLDLTAFLRLTGEARAAGSAPAEAAKLFRQALELWRGPALAGLEPAPIRQQAAVLDEQRVAAAEEWIDLELAAGHEQEIVAELVGLVERHPLRERLRAQLMLALHRLGRQADALAEYRRTHELLRDELGVEPGRPLRELHRAILTGEAAEPAHDREPAAPVRSLPRTIGDFTGRDEAVQRLAGAAAEWSVLTIDGMAGSGKTTLALRMAALVGAAYPDAQIFLDLHGHSEQEPLGPGAALLLLLRQLGVPAGRIPQDEEGRAALWRSETASRRALVILDNAASSAQVTRLLPASPTSLCLVTSRRRLAGLDGAYAEVLELLTEEEAVALLTRIVGKRVVAEPEAARELVRACGRLPLAIRLAASRLVHRPRWAVSDLVRRFRESALPELAAEDRTVAGAFALSFGQLPERSQRLFRLLGLFPAEQFRAVSAAALADLPEPEAQDILDSLVDVHLIEEPDPERYRLHDLVRQYAAALAAALPETERRAALTTLVDVHLHASAELGREQDSGAAEDYPDGAPVRPDLVAVAVADPAWREEQRPLLVPLIRLAADLGRTEQAWQLARVNWQFLFYGNYLDELLAAQTAGLTAARAAGDARGEALMSNYLASGMVHAGRLHEARRLMTVMLDYQERTGNRAAAARARGNLCTVLFRLGRVGEALAQAELTYREEQRFAPARVLLVRSIMIGTYLRALGRHEEALRRARRGMITAAEEGLDTYVVVALPEIAQSRIELGQLDVAERLLRVALPLLRARRLSGSEGEALYLLGLLEHRRGRHEEAVPWLLACLDLARRDGMAPVIATASNCLGDVLRAMGDGTGAFELHTKALEISRRSELAREEARALRGLGDCVAAGDPAAARRYWQRAVSIFAGIESPEHDGVVARINCT
ncbi:AfsR/SARP family transcriptional regulator [Symbioplanes lichenis]|uniref:AfsR/SARP family transcriptional regulator n=1 Tax=Symbioplanes lichenis TaxID=1629072 RepID=UPI00273889A6|nr:BTAD domain-containing putative transcriptional regulator [Actinoplanes lichenis]